MHAEKSFRYIPCDYCLDDVSVIVQLHLSLSSILIDNPYNILSAVGHHRTHLSGDEA